MKVGKYEFREYGSTKHKCTQYEKQVHGTASVKQWHTEKAQTRLDNQPPRPTEKGTNGPLFHS